MNHPATTSPKRFREIPVVSKSSTPWRGLKSLVKGELLDSAFDCGRYATDASIYQMIPDAVLVPRQIEDVEKAIVFANTNGLTIVPRGGGTSQCGQTVNHGLAIDFSKHLNRIVDINPERLSCRVQPGIVLDQLNRRLREYGLWFPVDVSTSSRATIGGMSANNSCGSRSLRYGLMRDNVLAIQGLMANGNRQEFSLLNQTTSNPAPLVSTLLALGVREKEEIQRRFPSVMRRVGGYNIDALVDDDTQINLSHLLVGSEGSLCCFEEIELQLAPIPRNKVLGVCHFPDFYAAMDAAQHLVALQPVAVELIDRTMIELSMDIPVFQPIVKKFIRGEPDAVLLVEFAEEDPAENLRRLKSLSDTMATLGFAWEHAPEKQGGVVEAVDPEFQKQIFEVRKAGLNIMMSMKEARKPISFVEDCAVELKDLAEYTDRLTNIFRKHDTMGTWYAHASVGCLHVRPVLNMRLNQDVKAMRAIAEEAFDMVLEYKGSHSGEHGDGIVRSEFHQKMFGERMVKNFEEVKRHFDPDGIFNPGKIVNPPKMDDRSLFRYHPDYKESVLDSALDWSDWPGGGNGFQGAVEMCNNNGACRKLVGGSMCPSYRVTLNEKDSVRGRANTLRLALSGQLGKDALGSEEMAETLKLCVGCKSCKRECPTGVDMARMKIEASRAHYTRHGHSLHQKIIANLPMLAPWFAKVSWLANLPSRAPIFARLMEPLTGFARDRALPRWRPDYYRHSELGPADGKRIILFADTFNTYFEPENLRAAAEVMAAAGYRVISPGQNARPLCCGRTWLTQGRVEKARAEMLRIVEAYSEEVATGTQIVGIEPSCTEGLRDEIGKLLGTDNAHQVGNQIISFEQFVVQERDKIQFVATESIVKLHGHCHQKAAGQMDTVVKALESVPGLVVEPIESSCCGMAGAFGYAKDTADISIKMAEQSLLPAVREASPEHLIVASGTSCRHQIELGSHRQAIHVARLLKRNLNTA